MIDFTVSELEAQVRAVVQENPNKTYKMADCDGTGNEGCLYFDLQGNPSCLIGQAFSRLGFTIDDFTETSNFMDVGALLKLWAGTPESESKWLVNVQGKQDDGFNWGYAVRYADSNLEPSSV